MDEKKKLKMLLLEQMIVLFILMGIGFFCYKKGIITDEVSRKLCAMVNKVKPDIVICGPAFNYADYAAMCARVADDINRTTEAKAFAAMSQENEETIAAYKDKVMIVKTPKKGGMGLNDSLKHICQVAKALSDGDPGLEALKQSVCF